MIKNMRNTIIGVVKLLISVALVSACLVTTAKAVESIKVGVIGPMQFSEGIATWRGAELAAEDINAAGGVTIAGKKYNLQLVKADSNELKSIVDAVSAMERLITVHKVDFVVGGYRSEAVLAMQEPMADHRVVFLNTCSGSPTTTKQVKEKYNRYKYYFKVDSRTAPGGAVEDPLLYTASLYPIIKAVRKTLGVEKPRLAIIADKAAWTESICELVPKLASDMGIEVVGVWRTAYLATDMSGELSAVKAAGAHIIFAALGGAGGVTFLKQWSKLQIPAAVGGEIIEATHLAPSEDVAGTYNWGATVAFGARSPMTDKTKPFIDKFLKKYGDITSGPDTSSHDALFILKNAIEKAGTLNSEAVVSALEKTDYVGVKGRLVFSSLQHVTPHTLFWGPGYITNEAVQWQNGKQVTYWPDGTELPLALIKQGAPTGWDKVHIKNIGTYVLPPWVVTYWKNKK